jgi:hypothetical protein
VGPAHPRIFLAHPRIKVKHLLKTKYICNNLKKESNTKALNGMIKILEKFGVYSVIISIFFHRLNLIYVDLCLWSVSSGGLKVVFCSTLPEFENFLLCETDFDKCHNLSKRNVKRVDRWVILMTLTIAVVGGPGR